MNIKSSKILDFIKSSKWLKRFGLAGFLFFLIKGLIWLAILFFAGDYFLS